MKNRQERLIVTLLTDYGTEDGYVGAIKGVLVKGVPQVSILDISHNIQPYNFRQAAFSLMNYAFLFPRNTVHLVVVDPGVGTSREGLVIQAADFLFVGPNNGVFSYIYQRPGFQSWKIQEEKFHHPISATFHGRDIFAPAVVKILQGNPVSQFCTPITHLTSFYESFEDLGNNEYRLKIIHVDHFGNLILNFRVEDWDSMGSPPEIRIQVNHSFLVGIMRTFSDVARNQLLLTWDSRGFLQIAQNCGNAAHTLRMKEGDHIVMKV